MRERLPLPEKIKNAPSLMMGLEFFYAAFMDLTTCRAVGMSPAPIPWSAIQDYADVHDVQGEQREELFYHIRSLDQAYLEYHERKQEEERKQKSSS